MERSNGCLSLQLQIWIVVCSYFAFIYCSQNSLESLRRASPCNVAQLLCMENQDGGKEKEEEKEEEEEEFDGMQWAVGLVVGCGPGCRLWAWL